MFSLLTVAVFLWYLDRTSKQLHILTHSEVLDRDVLWMIRFLCHKHAKLWFGGWREQLWEISQGPGQVGHHVSSNARQCTIMKEDDSTASVAYLTFTWHHQGGTRSPAEVGSTQGRKAVRRHPGLERFPGWRMTSPSCQPTTTKPLPRGVSDKELIALNCELYKLLCPWPVYHFCFLPPFCPLPFVVCFEHWIYSSMDILVLILLYYWFNLVKNSAVKCPENQLKGLLKLYIFLHILQMFIWCLIGKR